MKAFSKFNNVLYKINLSFGFKGLFGFKGFSTSRTFRVKGKHPVISPKMKNAALNKPELNLPELNFTKLSRPYSCHISYTGFRPLLCLIPDHCRICGILARYSEFEKNPPDGKYFYNLQDIFSQLILPDFDFTPRKNIFNQTKYYLELNF